jgi:hypothetical protein
VCQEALRLAAKTGDDFIHGLAHRVLADTLIRSDIAEAGPPRTPCGPRSRIQARIEALPELARTYLAYARLLRTLGERARLLSLPLSMAVELFTEMEMLTDLTRARNQSQR